MTDVIVSVVKAVGMVSAVEIKGVDQVEFTGRQIYIEGGNGAGHHFSLDEVDAVTLGQVMAVDLVYYDSTIRVENVSEIWLSASDLVNVDTLWFIDGGGKMAGKYPLECLQAVDLGEDRKQAFLQSVEQERERINKRLEEIEFEKWMEEQKDFIDWFRYYELESEERKLRKELGGF